MQLEAVQLAWIIQWNPRYSADDTLRTHMQVKTIHEETL